MDSFNQYLQDLISLDIDYQLDTSFDLIEKELRDIIENYGFSFCREIQPQELAQALLEEGQRPLQPILYELKIYYPISEGEFPPTPILYRSRRPITSAELINSIAAVYNTKLENSNIQAYIEANPRYEHLNEPILRIPVMGGPKLRDVFTEIESISLIPYEDGYLLHLER